MDTYHVARNDLQSLIIEDMYHLIKNNTQISESHMKKITQPMVMDGMGQVRQHRPTDSLSNIVNLNSLKTRTLRVTIKTKGKITAKANIVIFKKTNNDSEDPSGP